MWFFPLSLVVNNVIEPYAIAAGPREATTSKIREILSLDAITVLCWRWVQSASMWLPFVRLYYYWKPTKGAQEKTARNLRFMNFIRLDDARTANRKKYRETFHFHCWTRKREKSFQNNFQQHTTYRLKSPSRHFACMCMRPVCVCAGQRRVNWAQAPLSLGWIWIKSFRGEAHDGNLHTEGPLSTWQLCISMTSRD